MSPTCGARTLGRLRTLWVLLCYAALLAKQGGGLVLPELPNDVTFFKPGITPDTRAHPNTVPRVYLCW